MASRQRSGSQRRLRCRTAGAASPPKLRYLDADMVTVYETGDDGKKRRLATLLWGDSVRLVGKSGDYWKLDFTSRQWNEETRRYYWKRHDAFISGRTKFRDESVLKVRFVDVGQGDAAIVESPRGQIVLIDGGEEDHLYNYLTAAWAHLLRTKPRHAWTGGPGGCRSFWRTSASRPVGWIFWSWGWREPQRSCCRPCPGWRCDVRLPGRGDRQALR